MTLHDKFRCFAAKVSYALGTLWANLSSFSFVLIWLVYGFYCHWSAEHGDLFYKVTAGITFLMVFVIQNSQNRDSEALHLKLDEIIKSLEETNDRFAGAENKTEEELEELKKELDGSK